MFDKPTKNEEEEEGMRDQSLSGAYHTHPSLPIAPAETAVLLSR